MNKNAIKKFAVEARKELIFRVSQMAVKYGISDEETGNPNDDSANGYIFSPIEKTQRAELIKQVKNKGYNQVMEEVAYTWFNRFSALRFMEVNGYLPSRVRIFTNENNEFKPQILTEAIHMELDNLNMEKVYALKDANDNDALYKYLIITQCNALNCILPGMFQKISDYTELLFPDNLLRENSIIQKMIDSIPEEDWKDQVQILGWLYQYYNTEKKDAVFAALKKNVKINKENIPAATQLFTPDWIVRYMVENSLGRLWIEGHPNDELKSQWKYYLEEAEQEPDVLKQLAVIREEYKSLNPEDILCVDPCSGSGHILAYMFDILVQIYETYGVNTRTAVKSIIENNIYGLDIDDRAVQLAYFAVMMKGCQYDRRFLLRKDGEGNPKVPQPRVYAIAESNNIESDTVEYFCGEDGKLKKAIDTIILELRDAKEYGSILTVTPQDWSAIYDRFEEIKYDISVYRESALTKLLPLVHTAEVLAKKYDVVVTNPPYMGASNMNGKLNDFIKEKYTDYKSDFFSAFVIKCSRMAKTTGYLGFLTPYVWMFIQSYTKMREYLYSHTTIETLIQFEYSALAEATVPICAFTFSNMHINKKGCYLRLTDFRGGMEIQKQKALEAINNHKCGFYYEQCTDNFEKIPGAPVAYWVSENFYNIFLLNKADKFALKICKGGYTGNNDRYLKLWHEVEVKKLSYKWMKYSKGGPFRKWYGNSQHVIFWKNNGEELKSNPKSGMGASKYYNMPHFVWSGITSGKPSFRYDDKSVYFDDVSPAIIFSSEEKWYLLGLMNSKVVEEVLSIIAPTFHFQAGDIKQIPVNEDIKYVNCDLIKENITISKSDWDSFETSWDFSKHPLIRQTSKISEAYAEWENECEDRFNKLKANEEELNRIFIDIYGLQDELTPEVEDKDVTVRKADLERDIKSFISYAVGCMFGRYSIYKESLIFAGEQYSLQTFVDKMNESSDTISSKEANRAYHNEGVEISEMFFPDNDNIIPISADEYFEDDIVGRFVKFVREVYGEDTLQENLKFIADALGGKGQPKDVILSYFVNGFYKDHCKTYQKRPIYWQFESGKKNGFKCLIYMHRYQPDLLARIRTDYVHEQQARYDAVIADLEQNIEKVSAGERVKINKQLKTLNDQAAEIHVYEEKLHHLADKMISIDLDDGVKKNYAIFQDVLAKIK